MPRPKIVAPPNPAVAGRKRAEELRAKRNRTPAETAELVDLLADRVAALEADTA